MDYALCRKVFRCTLYLFGCWNIVVSVVAKLRLDCPELKSWPGQELCLYSKLFILAPELTQLPVQWVMGALSTDLKQLGCEALSLPSSAKFKNEWRYTSAPPICFHGVNRDIFALQLFLSAV
jgi:hypothetical protein